MELRSTGTVLPGPVVVAQPRVPRQTMIYRIYRNSGTRELVTLAWRGNANPKSDSAGRAR